MKLYDNGHCPLCTGQACVLYFQDKQRTYLQCRQCRLVFVPKEFHLSHKKEKAVYDLHKNSSEDMGYRRFLSRLANPVLARIKPNSQGLDFGCGPGPALSLLFEEGGHSMALYDPFYFDDRSLLSNQYDFICATEVIEHLRKPQEIFKLLFGMLAVGGQLGIMTKMVIDKDAFSTWHYIRDLTHICFYSEPAFTFLAKRYDAEITYIENDAILFCKR